MGKQTFDTDDNAIIRTIQDSVKTEVIAVDGDDFVTREVYNPPKPAIAQALTTHTLQSVVDYIKNDAKFDAVVPATNNDRGLAVHVVSESRVQVVAQLEHRFRQREVLLNAECIQVIGSSFQFGHYKPLEEFIIALRSLFARTDHVDELTRILGRVEDTAIKEFEDDGVSQAVTARTGVTTVRDVPVPNVVELIPFRTFREIEQPKAEFFLRLAKNPRDDMPPLAALFETDGGAWKLESIERIKKFLSDQIDNVPIIA